MCSRINRIIAIMLVLFTVFIHVGCNEKEPDANEMQIYIKKHIKKDDLHYFISPDGLHSVYTCLGREGYGQDLYLEDNTSGKVKIAWSSRRWIHFKWAPDSMHVAVIDHADPDASIVLLGLLKRDSDTGICYVYQSPSEFPVKWDLKRWDLEGNSAILSRTERLDSEPWKVTSEMRIKIGSECIVPSVYEE